MTLSDKLKLIAANMVDIFDGGKQEGYKVGMEAEHSAFWDGFQDYGNRVLYNNAFQNSWTDNIFQPKYDIKPTSAGYMFAGTRVANLKKCLEDNDVMLDLSGATSIDRLFSDSPNLTYLPEISTVSAPHLQNVVYNCKNLISIENIVLKDDGSQTFNDNSFKNCENLVEIRFSGTIGNTINFQWSKKLSMPSLASILSALSKTASGQTITFPTTARATYDNETYSGRWDELVAEHPNWTFKYA